MDYTLLLKAAIVTMIHVFPNAHIDSVQYYESLYGRFDQTAIRLDSMNIRKAYYEINRQRHFQGTVIQIEGQTYRDRVIVKEYLSKKK